MKTIFVETLCDLACNDNRIWLITGDLGYNALEKFANQFPNRFLNVGVAEQNMVGVASGLSRSGKTVFVYSIVNFATFRCLEQIRNDVCYHRANVKIVATGGGYMYGSLGYSHHGIEDIAIMRPLPGITIVAPCDNDQVRSATRAVAEMPGPCYLRLGRMPKSLIGTVDIGPSPFEIGKATPIRKGLHVGIFCTGSVLDWVIPEVSILKRDHAIEAEVWCFHTVKPLDTATILDVAHRLGRIVTVEEHSIIGGLGSAVAEVLAESDIPCRFARFGAPDALNAGVYSREGLVRNLGDLVEIVRSL